MTPAWMLAGVMWLALVLYFLLGGADFGGGFWDLFARGPRKAAQRALIEQAMGPVWEVNHVWLILVVVLLFGGFPKAFSLITIALHVPLTLFLLGVVFRGSAFAFRAYTPAPAGRLRWGRVFSWASVLAPMLLGASVAAVASGSLAPGGEPAYFAPWLTPFAAVVGLFALGLCALLAATYLAYEAQAVNAALAEDFRRRALGAGVAVGLLAFLALGLSREAAPRLFEGLTARPWTWPFHAATAASAATTLVALARRRYALARLAVGAQTAFVLLGWALAQQPELVVGALTVSAASARPAVQELLLWALAAGSLVLGPSLYVLFRVFKAQPR